MAKNWRVLTVITLMSAGMLFPFIAGAGTRPALPVNNNGNERMEWWLDARFGMMIHWGAYAQAGGFWKGEFEGGYSEWLKFRQIPNADYDSLIHEFNPVDFNAGKWVDIAKKAGMKYIVFTAKHHDGFAMYDSKVTDYDIVDMTKFHRDPVAELSAACQKAGLKFGVYYSVDRDWHHPDATCDDHYQQCNFWDYPQNKSGALERWHNSYFPNFAVKQITELVTRYPIDIVWFDGIGIKTPAEVALLDSIIHTTRPACLINSRISNFVGSTSGDYGSKGDNETPGGYQPGGWENPGTLGFSYGYSANDKFMSPRQAVHNLIDIVSKGGNYLLNVGPNGQGIIIPEAADILRDMGSWLDIYGESIYGADGIPVNPPDNIRFTVKPNKLFIHLLDWSGDELNISGMGQILEKYFDRVGDICMLSDGLKRPLRYTISNGVLSIDLTSCPFTVSQRNKLAEVLVISELADEGTAAGPYPDWKYSGSMNILTTPEGAGLHISALVKDFPLLVRLNSATFNFDQCLRDGADLRFASAEGAPLDYQIEEWNPIAGTASIWVRIPVISGNSRQEIKVYWGRNGVKSESNGNRVFNESNGYLCVTHSDDPPVDETGNVPFRNVGSVMTPGIIGQARHFDEGQGISGGDQLKNFPVGSGSSTTEAWVRATLPNGMVVAWGNEEKTGKVCMQFASPPKIRMDCYWSGANVNGNNRLPLAEWVHLVHTYSEGDSRVYVNGILDGVSNAVKNPLAIKSPAGIWIGGWKDDYWLSGDIDEVRVSGVARSADWIKLQYENQKALQTAVGNLVQPGNVFNVSTQKIEIKEGETVLVNAQAGGAQKVYWITDRDGIENIVSTDRFSYVFDAGRITGDQTLVLKFKAVFPDTVRVLSVPVTISENIPEPVFTLKCPAGWNGRDTVEVIPEIRNLNEMTAMGAGILNYQWRVDGGAVIKKAVPGKLLLLRSQYTGKISVRLTLSNGGAGTNAVAEMMVTEPDSDPWILRLSGDNEKPVDNQFYTRNGLNFGVLNYNGMVARAADSVFIRVYADDQLFSRQAVKLGKDKSYRLSSPLKPGLIRYRVEFGTVKKGEETVLEKVENIVCGDAYIIDGQSNAEANDYGRAVNPYTSDFLRSFGCADTDPGKCRLNLWGNAVSYDNQGAKLQIGYWGIELGKQLIEGQKMPVCIINGSVGGSRIDVHQRNEENPTDSTTIYGRLLWRIQQAGLTHGIRGVFWHQGENDQGAAGPTGRFGWEDYRQYFIDMSAAWKQDYPNILHYYIFQIWPRSCAMTENGSDNVLREVQRTLPRYFSNMSVMSTLGIKPPGGCHFPPEGYAEIAHLIAPLVERDNYGLIPERSITPPDLLSAFYTSDHQDEIALQFDQPVVWNDSLISQFYPDGESGKIESGSVSGNTIRLRLKTAGEAGTITYLDSKTWSQDNLLWGTNGIAALTFWEAEIKPFSDILTSGIQINAGDSAITGSLSPNNWVCRPDYISSSINGSSITLKFQGTSSVVVLLNNGHMRFSDPNRFPILAWTVNGGPVQIHQIRPNDHGILLASGVSDPIIDLYIKGMSPFENRFQGDLPENSVKITGFRVDEGGSVVSAATAGKFWLTFGDSILSGDGATLQAGEGRPADDNWAASADSRASYAYLLARHFGYREGRIAFGGYNWGGGMAKVPAMSVLIDSLTSSASRLTNGLLDPVPDVVLINLGENGTPAGSEVIQTLYKLRSRVAPATKIIVMVPVSGRAGAALTDAFHRYKQDTGDKFAFFFDLGRLKFATCDGQHPTAAGHQAIFKAAVRAFEEVLDESSSKPGELNSLAPQRVPLRTGVIPEVEGKPSDAYASITIYRPEKPNGTAVVICPGGGYGMLVTGPEGHEIAQWLNKNGITGVVLEYRLPKGRAGVPLMDAQRAIRLVRSKAGEWGLDPDRIGIIGFSAGGHLASTAATHFNMGDPKSPDPVERISCRPDFAILIYPVISMGTWTHQGSKTNLMGPDPAKETVNWYSNELQVTKDTPPVFLAHAQDDQVVNPANSQLMYEALIAHGVKAEYLKLPYGGHGLNGYSGPMWDEWQTKVLSWLTNLSHH